MTEAPLKFSCTCGEVTGELSADALPLGAHLDCRCTDCRAAELYFGQPDPAPGAVDIFHTSPLNLRFTKGQDKLGLMRLGPNGLMRWYATCCNAPIGNTLKTPKIPFIGMATARFDDPSRFGPLVAHGFVPQADGKLKTTGVLPVMIKLLRRALPARLSGRWRNTPFFDPKTGDPVVKAYVLSKEERQSLTN